MRTSKIILTIILYCFMALSAFIFASFAMTNTVIKFGDLKLSISINTMVSLGFTVSALFGGYLSEHYGKKILFLGGAFLLSLGTLMFGVTTQLALLVTSTLLFGVGFGLVEGLGMALVGDLYPRNRRSAFNSIQGFFGIGALLGASCVGIILERNLGWQWLYIFAGGTGFLFFAIGLMSKFPKKSDEHFDFKIYRSIIRRPVFLLCAGMSFLYVASEGFPAWWFPRFMKRASSASFLLLGGGLGLFWLGTTVSRILSSFIPRKFNTRHLLLLCSFTGILIFIIIYFLRANDAVMLPLSFLLGVAMGPVWGTVQSVAVDHIPNRSGVVASAIAALGSFGSVVNQPVFGSIGEHAGLPFAIIYAAFLLFVIPALLLAGRKFI